MFIELKNSPITEFQFLIFCLFSMSREIAQKLVKPKQPKYSAIKTKLNEENSQLNKLCVRGRNPRDLDQFFTKQSVADECIDILKNSLSLSLAVL